jgi:hypothetical protein
MYLLDLNIEDKLEINSIIKCNFVDNYSNINNINVNDSENLLNSVNEIHIIKFLGEGAYGKVFKIEINSKFYALKIYFSLIKK